MYKPNKPPALSDEMRILAQWLEGELLTIAQAFNKTEGFELVTLYAQPSKLRDGLVVKADGTSWNPGAGAGIYAYYAGSWKKLG